MLNPSTTFKSTTCYTVNQKLFIKRNIYRDASTLFPCCGYALYYSSFLSPIFSPRIDIFMFTFQKSYNNPWQVNIKTPGK